MTRKITHDYTIQPADSGLEVDASLGDVTLKLPPSHTATVAVSKIDNGPHAVIIETPGCETVRLEKAGEKAPVAFPALGPRHRR